MKTLTEVVRLVGRVDQVELTRWVEVGWVTPERQRARRAGLFRSRHRAGLPDLRSAP